jgi:hypothetical protein
MSRYEPVFFSPKEWRCKCFKCKGPSAEQPLDSRLLGFLDICRASFGSPVLITSGWRCQAHNARIKGAAKRSLHLQGRAADVTTRKDFVAFCSMVKRIGALPAYKPKELLVYATFIHIAF